MYKILIQIIYIYLSLYIYLYVYIYICIIVEFSAEHILPNTSQKYVLVLSQAISTIQIDPNPGRPTSCRATLRRCSQAICLAVHHRNRREIRFLISFFSGKLMGEIITAWWLVHLALWKIMGCELVTMMKFPSEWKNNPNVPNHQIDHRESDVLQGSWVDGVPNWIMVYTHNHWGS
jgi:hypothetical protein